MQENYNFVSLWKVRLKKEEVNNCFLWNLIYIDGNASLRPNKRENQVEKKNKKKKHGRWRP